MRLVGLVIHTCSNHHVGKNNRQKEAPPEAFVVMYCSLCVCLFVEKRTHKQNKTRDFVIH